MVIASEVARAGVELTMFSPTSQIFIAMVVSFSNLLIVAVPQMEILWKIGKEHG
jgi:hypothetical protein